MININTNKFLKPFRIIKRCLTEEDYFKYRIMRRKHKWQLIKLSMQAEDWDFSFMHKYVLTSLNQMLEYYETNINVWQTDESLIPLIESLKDTIAINEQIVACEIKDESRLYKEFYNSIGENILQWWD